MTPITRRLVYVVTFEALAVALTSVVLASLGHAPAQAGITAISTSLIALVWNLTYTAGFERWEARQKIRGRSLLRRAAHALGFEAGLVIAIVPTLAFLLGVTLLEAVILEAGLIVFFLVYTFVFNLAFDSIFGLPASAQVKS